MTKSHEAPDTPASSELRPSLASVPRLVLEWAPLFTPLREDSQIANISDSVSWGLTVPSDSAAPSGLDKQIPIVSYLAPSVTSSLVFGIALFHSLLWLQLQLGLPIAWSNSLWLGLITFSVAAQYHRAYIYRHLVEQLQSIFGNSVARGEHLIAASKHTRKKWKTYTYASISALALAAGLAGYGSCALKLSPEATSAIHRADSLNQLIDQGLIKVDIQEKEGARSEMKLQLNTTWMQPAETWECFEFDYPGQAPRTSWAVKFRDKNHRKFLKLADEGGWEVDKHSEYIESLAIGAAEVPSVSYFSAFRTRTPKIWNRPPGSLVVTFPTDTLHQPHKEYIAGLLETPVTLEITTRTHCSAPERGRETWQWMNGEKPTVTPISFTTSD